jgi:FKBP12-rapamycin complex-associated protein
MFFNLLVSLIGVDVGNKTAKVSRFANYLRNLLPSSDVSIMEMAAKAVGILALSSGTYAAQFKTKKIVIVFVRHIILIMDY